METRDGLLYSRDHVWAKVQNREATIGITDYAQEALAEVVCVVLPKIGTELSAGGVLGLAETVKAVVEIYSPVSGRVTAVNQQLTQAPEGLNDRPYDEWIAACELVDSRELDALMSEEAYRSFCTECGA